MLKNFVAYYDCSQRAVESSDMTFAKVSYPGRSQVWAKADAADP